MSQPSSNAYFVFPSPSPNPSPPAPTPKPAPASSPKWGKWDLTNREYVTSDTYCLYNTQGQMVCSKRSNASNTNLIAPFGNENKK
jgi:hypothetical protein